MEQDIVSIVFRGIAVIASLFLLVISLFIYKKTRDATRGWLYLSWFGASFFLWSASTMSLKMLGMPVPRYLLGALFLINISISVVLAYSRLADDFWLEKPAWLTTRTSIIALIVSFVGLFILNLILYPADFSANPLVKILSISHQTVGIAFVIGAFSGYYLFLRSRDLKWGTAFFALLIGAASMMIGQYYDNCCGAGGQLSQDELCSAYDLDYVKVYEAPCISGLVMAGRYYQLGLIASIIILSISYCLILRGLSASTPGSKK